jgi:uncharacterized membrane protein YqjE
MTLDRTLAHMLANHGLLLGAAGLLLVCAIVLIVLIGRSTRWHHPPLRPLEPADGDVAELKALIEDAQSILSATTHDLENNRARLERLRLEAGVRSHAGTAGQQQ